METRRKLAGQHIKQTRRALKYRSAKAFAAEIGVHESSVANAEIGSERAGDSLYQAIELGFGWPSGSIRAYIDGQTDQLPGESAPASKRPAAAAEELSFTPTDKDRARWRTMTVEQITDEGDMIGRTISRRMQKQYLLAALEELDNLDRESAQAQTSDVSEM